MLPVRETGSEYRGSLYYFLKLHRSQEQLSSSCNPSAAHVIPATTEAEAVRFQVWGQPWEI